MARLRAVASLDPSCRLLCLALLSSASLISGAVCPVLLSIGAIALLLIEGFRIPDLLRDACFIALFALFSAAIRFIGLPEAAGATWSAAGEAGLYGLRLAAAFFAGKLFYASTSASELRDAATRMTRRLPFARGLDLGLGLSMVISFIPLIFEEWRASLEAAKSRGMPRRPGLARQAQFVTAFLRRLMLRAVATPEALVARGWTHARGIRALSWRARDTIVSIASALVLIVAAVRLV